MPLLLSKHRVGLSYSEPPPPPPLLLLKHFSFRHEERHPWREGEGEGGGMEGGPRGSREGVRARLREERTTLQVSRPEETEK